MKGFHEQNPRKSLKFKLWYDQLQVKVYARSGNVEITEDSYSEESFTSLSVMLMMLRNMFDNVKVTQNGKSVLLHVDADIYNT